MSDQVICLSDSDDEIGEPTRYNADKNDDKGSDENQDIQADFDFPPINFHYRVKNVQEVVNPSRDKDEIGKNGLTAFVAPPITSTNSYRDNVDLEVRFAITNDRPKNDEISTETRGLQERHKSKKPPRNGNSHNNVDERMRAKEQAAIDKRLLALERKNRKNLQPGECLKFMTVAIHTTLEDSPFFPDIRRVLENYEISYATVSHTVPHSITWTRVIESHYVNSSNEICQKKESQKEKQILIIWTLEKFVAKIEDRSLISALGDISSLFPDERLTLVVYGMEKYLESKKKSQKHRSDKGDAKRTKNQESKISRYDLEFSLAEIQLSLGCNSALVETTEELAMLVYRFTKAIAEIPLKLEKRQKIADKIDWYAMGDNRDTVRVDKDGNGLKRLWQQQLCQFNLASLETAEAICSVYSSPRELMAAYANCTPAEGEKLLKDIPIRRAAGPLSTARKIGPELSKKIFVMFTSKDGEESLGNDRDS